MKIQKRLLILVVSLFLLVKSTGIAGASEENETKSPWLKLFLRGAYCGAFWRIDSSCLPVQDISVLSVDETSSFTIVSPGNTSEPYSIKIISLNGEPGEAGERGIPGVGYVGAKGDKGATGPEGPNIFGSYIDLDSEVAASGNANQIFLSNGGTIPSWSNISTLLTGGNGISTSGSTSVSFGLGTLTSDWNQTGPYDIKLGNEDSDIKILESSGGTYFGELNIGDLSSDAVYTLSGSSGTVVTGANAASQLSGWDQNSSDDLTTSNYSSTLNSVYLKVASNLSDLGSASSARTNLGLGTISTQNSSNVAVSGGAIDGTTVGGVTPAAGTFTTVTGNTSVTTPHYLSSGSTPSISTGSGAGSGASASVSGTDASGEITLTSGTLPSTSSTILTVTFASSYSAAPNVVFSPSNSTAAVLSGLSMIYVTTTGSTFVFTSGTTSLTGSSTYKWQYQVIK